MEYFCTLTNLKLNHVKFVYILQMGICNFISCDELADFKLIAAGQNSIPNV
jgi:hypothetical protein